jgi:hypothetical protein
LPPIQCSMVFTDLAFLAGSLDLVRSRGAGSRTCDDVGPGG